jgi:hypothetical protein
MQMDHYNTAERAEAYLAAEGFTEVAINTWCDDHGQTATVSPFLGNVVHVQFPQEVAK